MPLRVTTWASVLLPLASILLGCASDASARRPAVRDADIPPYTHERRLEIYRLADDAAATLWRAPAVVTGEREFEAEGEKGRVVASCRDGDRKPEAFELLRLGETSGPDFGFFFDLDRDGRVDYLVFNGGPLLDEAKRFVWMNYHWIDSNADGRVDVAVYNDVDLDGDGLVDPGWTAWVYDRDHDGLPDAAEYLSPDERREIAPSEGCFVVSRPIPPQRACGSDGAYFGALDEVLARLQPLR